MQGTGGAWVQRDFGFPQDTLACSEWPRGPPGVCEDGSAGKDNRSRLPLSPPHVFIRLVSRKGSAPTLI